MNKFIDKIPEELKSLSGSVFYSGNNAFIGRKDLYILGLNPGGRPSDDINESIESSIKQMINRSDKDWCAYRDESWEGFPPGTYKMQPRILHLFKYLEISPGCIPASNIIFVRSQGEKGIAHKINNLFVKCWPFHESVINELKPKVILCLGQTAGGYIRKMLRANKLIDEFEEKNNRKWKSQAFENENGVKVVVATHPSRADWTAQNTDPSAMIKRLLSEQT